MKNFKFVTTIGIAAAVIFQIYLISRPSKILGVEYDYEYDFEYEEIEVEQPAYDEVQLESLTKALWGEARGVESDTQKAAVCWVVLNRVDSPDFPNTVYSVLTQPNQFNGFSEDNPIDPELEEIAADVLTRWHDERNGKLSVGRIIPDNYYYFCGNGTENIFTMTLTSGIWDWSLESPYES